MDRGVPFTFHTYTEVMGTDLNTDHGVLSQCRGESRISVEGIHFVWGDHFHTQRSEPTSLVLSKSKGK